jgi:hypothetical protein
MAGQSVKRSTNLIRERDARALRRCEMTKIITSEEPRSFDTRLQLIVLSIVIVIGVPQSLPAECPLDHLIIGCNEDGVAGTDDDRKLFVDCWQKYRNSGSQVYANWYYPLHKSIFPSYPYRLGEPGFDAFQDYNLDTSYTYDPNRCLAGRPDEDYRIIVECVSISPGLRAEHKDYPQFTIGQVGKRFNHSYIHKMRGDPHMHMSYQAVDGENLHWISFRLYDEIADGNQYEPSEPFTMVFNREPLAGDLAICAKVDMEDMARLGHYWLLGAGSIHNDYYERADANKDGYVDLADFALLASNWRQSLAAVSDVDSPE